MAVRCLEGAATEWADSRRYLVQTFGTGVVRTPNDYERVAGFIQVLDLLQESVLIADAAIAKDGGHCW